MPQEAVDRPLPALETVQQPRLRVVLTHRVHHQLTAPAGLEQGVCHPAVPTSCAKGKDDAARQLGPGIGAAQHECHQVFVHRPQVEVEVRDEVVGVLEPEPNSHVAESAACEFPHHVNQRAWLTGPSAMVGEHHAHAVTSGQPRQPREVVGRTVDFGEMRLLRHRRGRSRRTEPDLGPQVRGISAPRRLGDERLDRGGDDAESAGVVRLFIRRHGKRRPHPGELNLVLAQSVELDVERGQVLVAPVPHDLVDADAP